MTAESQLGAFDCLDEDLNSFLMHDAISYAEKKLAYTFILQDQGNIIGYYSLLNDKISRQDVANAIWRKVKKLFPHGKHFSSYPAVKIGRLAIAYRYKGKGIGRNLIKIIKMTLSETQTISAFRFLTVDAYLSATAFYEKNGFRMMVADDDDRHTRLMFFDMMEL